MQINFSPQRLLFAFYALLSVLMLTPALRMQGQSPATTQATLDLPDAPTPANSGDPVPSAITPLPMASHVQKYIDPGQQAPRLTVGDKILIGFRDVASPLTAAGWVVSAGYSQAINTTPNYGRNGKAYAQRLGAAAARSASEGIFSDAVLAPILHEDPRYYKMGKGHSGGRRAFYAITRTVVTRTDDGHSTVNFSLLGGNLAGSAMTQAYYPPQDRGFGETMKTFGFSVGGSAFRFIVAEFLDDTLQAVHLKKPR